VAKCRLSQKSGVLRFGQNPWILWGFCVAKLGRKTSDLCDVFCDKRTETLTQKTLCLPSNFFKWPLVS